ncbi:coproporphyrinogen III oxidase [Betaproteobacteria bacterium]|nr:coproporphyrinogen III oxidase [Betaproteobacteria bacterium]GHU41633.1 coproporphyrinogen III oxidase [Betaproteobacteria bacterium]
MTPASLYIHIPWCVRKCPYCDFNSHAVRDALPETAYLAALVADLEFALPLVKGRAITSIFFGGGTPSLFSPDGIARLLTDIADRLNLPPTAEITLEANPGTVETDKLIAFRAAGINRVSLGIQSFNNTHLFALGRIHDRDEALRAATLAARHFERFNLDLMYGLPNQTLTDALADVETALEIGAPHLSCYQLTLEPNTPFAAQPPTLPDDDLCADMGEAIETRLTSAGFTHYETSAFARPDFQCEHNLNYWRFGDYLGIGAGAHSKLTVKDADGAIQTLRQMRWKSPDAYLRQTAAGNPIQEAHSVPAEQRPFEFLMNALRLSEGFSPALFASRTRLPFSVLQAKLTNAARDGLLDISDERIAPTPQGRRFLNRLLERFLD